MGILLLGTTIDSHCNKARRFWKFQIANPCIFEHFGQQGEAREDFLTKHGDNITF